MSFCHNPEAIAAIQPLILAFARDRYRLGRNEIPVSILRTTLRCDAVNRYPTIRYEIIIEMGLFSSWIYDQRFVLGIYSGFVSC